MGSQKTSKKTLFKWRKSESYKRVHSCPEALLRMKKFTRTETYTGSLYDTWGVLKNWYSKISELILKKNERTFIKQLSVEC